MGYTRHNAIIVSASYGQRVTEGEHWAVIAHSKAVELFGDIAAVTEVTPTTMNNYRSFLVAPDGSKEGWDLSDSGDAARDAFVTWLREQAYDDGSSPLDWVEVQFADDDRETCIIRCDDEVEAEV
jgi:hypothetical protein